MRKAAKAAIRQGKIAKGRKFGSLATFPNTHMNQNLV
jgi:hypothetical protein